MIACIYACRNADSRAWMQISNQVQECIIFISCAGMQIQKQDCRFINRNADSQSSAGMHSHAYMNADANAEIQILYQKCRLNWRTMFSYGRMLLFFPQSWRFTCRIYGIMESCSKSAKLQFFTQNNISVVPASRFVKLFVLSEEYRKWFDWWKLSITRWPDLQWQQLQQCSRCIRSSSTNL